AGRISINFYFFFSSRRRHTRSLRDWSSDVCSSDLGACAVACDREKSRPSHLAHAAGHGAGAGQGTPLDQARGVPERGREIRRFRSEERRVGKECRSWWATYHQKIKAEKVESDAMIA